jgi:hypothetical protein
VRLLACIFPLIDDKNSIFKNCIEIVHEFPSSGFSIEIITKFIPLVLDMDKEFMSLVWDLINRLYSPDIHNMKINTCFSIIIYSFDFLVGSKSTLLESNSRKIFEYILAGLRSHNESICKKALYVLKRILDLPQENLNCISCELFPSTVSSCNKSMNNITALSIYCWTM